MFQERPYSSDDHTASVLIWNEFNHEIDLETFRNRNNWYNHSMSDHPAVSITNDDGNATGREGTEHEGVGVHLLRFLF